MKFPFASLIYGSPLYEDSNDTRHTPIGKKLTLRMQDEDIKLSVGFPRLRECYGAQVLTYILGWSYWQPVTGCQ